MADPREATDMWFSYTRLGGRGLRPCSLITIVKNKVKTPNKQNPYKLIIGTLVGRES